MYLGKSIISSYQKFYMSTISINHFHDEQSPRSLLHENCRHSSDYLSIYINLNCMKIYKKDPNLSR